MTCQAAIGVTSSYNALSDLFERSQSFIKRLDIYKGIRLTSLMTEIIMKTTAQSLSVVALATKKMIQGRTSTCVVNI